MKINTEMEIINVEKNIEIVTDEFNRDSNSNNESNKTRDLSIKRKKKKEKKIITKNEKQTKSKIMEELTKNFEIIESHILKSSILKFSFRFVIILANWISSIFDY